MPYKFNESRRHKIKKALYKVTNWADYNNALRNRGDITIWFTQDAVNNWRPARIGGRGRLVEYSDLDTLTGIWKYKYGKNPKGYFTYTKTFIVSLNITAETPFKFSMDSAKHLIMNYYDMTQKNSLGYFGTYSVDWEKSIVTHHVNGGSLPWYIDTDQPRPFTIKGDTVIIGNNKTWRRVLVRAD
jgi:hypothetical protein